jgi:probable HAF family extracellular repeat protein
MVDIGALGPMNRAHAHAINNSGQVVGASTKKSSDCGFIWQKSKGMKELKLPGQSASPIRINDSGQVIGYFETREFPFFKSHKSYFLWDPEQGTIELDDISQSRGRFEAHDINNKGQIIGTQSKPGQDHVIILTPKAKQ